MKDNLFRKIAPFLFGAAVVVFIVLGIKSVVSQFSYTETTAVISSLTEEENIVNEDQKTHHVIVTYTVDGQEYETELGTYEDSMAEGQEIAIRYDPDDPGTVVKAGWKNTLAMFALAALCGAAGVSVVKRKGVKPEPLLPEFWQ